MPIVLDLDDGCELVEPSVGVEVAAAKLDDAEVAETLGPEEAAAVVLPPVLQYPKSSGFTTSSDT